MTTMLHAPPAARLLGFEDRPAVRGAVFASWFGAVLIIAGYHTFWRDEVRAFSLAVQGANVLEMLRGIQGEGHPGLWYLLLRGAHDLVGSPAVLGVVSIGVMAIAALLLLFLSPFPLWQAILFLSSGYFLFEYSVMARNYGISVPLMFLFAHFYERHRRGGVLLGVLLALLANTNAHSVVLVGGFVLFWGLDLLREQGPRWTPASRTLLLNAGIAAAGVLLCIATIYPTYNDAAEVDGSALSLRSLVTSVLLPGSAFRDMLWAYHGDPEGQGIVSSVLMSAFTLASTLGLFRRPSALIAAIATLIGLSVFFVAVYPGTYRHEALWLVFLISLYWIAQARGLPWLLRPRWLVASTGLVSMTVLMALQIPSGANRVADILSGRLPLSRASDLAALVKSRSDLQDAVVVAEPDYLVEALPYYIDNPTYLMRDERFGRVVRFSNSGRLDMSLNDTLRVARALHRDQGKPVLILLEPELDPSAPERTIKEGYNWQFHITSDQVRRFTRATQLLAQLRPAIAERFDVYLLKP